MSVFTPATVLRLHEAALGRCLQDVVRVEVVLLAEEEEEAAGEEAGEAGEEEEGEGAAGNRRAEAQLCPAP